MNIVVDTRMINHGGIGTYLRRLLPLLEPIQQLELNLPIYSIREQIRFSKKIPPCDLYWSPHFNVPLMPIKAKFRVTTIHDLYHLDHFQMLSLTKKFYVKTVLRKAIINSDHLITVSEFSKKRLLAYFPEVENKITVIHSGCDHLSQIKPKPLSNLPDRFYLSVGSHKSHKNRSILFDLLLEFPQMHLVIVGQPCRAQERVHFLENVSDAELAWLYQHAEALIFPSFYEGWGMPPLEAMQMGCPVIASNLASIPEACGQAALYFDPYNKQDLCEKISTLPKMREDLIAKGRKHASPFSWKKAAEKHLQVFESILI